MSRGRTATRNSARHYWHGEAVPRYGYRRLWALLERQGWEVDVKRVHRLYKAEGLMVRRLKRKRLSAAVR